MVNKEKKKLPFLIPLLIIVVVVIVAIVVSQSLSGEGEIQAPGADYSNSNNVEFA